MKFREALKQLYVDEEGCYECEGVLLGLTGAGHVVIQVGTTTIELGHTEDPDSSSPNKLINLLSTQLGKLARARRSNWKRTRLIEV